MKIVILISALLMALALFTCTTIRAVRNVPENSDDETRPQCDPGTDVDDIVSSKLTSDDAPLAENARNALLRYAKHSGACRTYVIRKLIKAMDKPDLNFVSDQRSYFLWSNGSFILGELKAVEAADFLIAHLDLNDGRSSSSMVHQPAILGIEKMGQLVVPKLDYALRNNVNRKIRLASALCLADIGGSQATESLKSSLQSESDLCVKRFVELLLKSPTEEILQQRIVAFRCGN